MLKSAFFLVALFACGYCQPPVVSITVANQSTVDGQVVPVVLVEGSNSSIVFRCTTNDTGAVIVLTIDPSDSLSAVESVGNTDTDKEYTVNNIQRDDSGTTFQCTDGGVNSAFTIDVQFAPNILNIMNGAGPEGGSANVTFTIEANPAVVESGINVSPTMPDDVVIINGSTVTLTYDDLERADNRSYSLLVENSVDSTMGTFDINVYFGPDFINNGGSIEVTDGEPLSIDCSVSALGSNPTTVSVTISGYDISGMMNVSDNGGSRVFNVTDAVTSNFNNRMYTCSASNGETMTSITYTVTVVQPTPPSTSIPLMPSSSPFISPSISLSRDTTTEPTRDPDPRGLSTGAIAGIAVAAVIVGIILIIVGVLLLVFVIMKMRDTTAVIKPEKGVTENSTKL